MTLLIEDRALLDSFRKGEHWAISKVYHAYLDQVMHLLRKGFSFMSGGQPVRFKGYRNAWDLECAVQDTFSHAFSPSARDAYDGVHPYGPYLVTIARNQVISRLRRDHREYRRRTALAADVGPAQPETPEEKAIQTEREQLVADFRATLDPTQLRFLELRFREERPLLEAARELKLTRMRARTLEQKLKQAFLRFLRRRGVVDHGGSSGSPLLLLTLGGGV